MEPALLKALADYGVVAVAFGLLLWHQIQRERIQTEQVRSLDTYVRDTMLTVIQANTAAITRFELVLERHVASDA